MSQLGVEQQQHDSSISAKQAIAPSGQPLQQQQQQQQQSDNLSVFCREVRNLLRSRPNCMIPFSKFVPAYHNHYGRQCCVYQLGYTKLIELLEAIPHVVQIIGDGTTNNRYITLTQREQIKRFASDLIKVVKSQPGKRLKLSQFGQAYEQVLGRKFRIEDYGTNNINILLAEIWEGTINIIPIKRELVDQQVVPKPLFVNTKIPKNNPVLEQLVASKELIYKPYITCEYPDALFEIPKRERSEKEIKRTKYFIWDVIELLSRIGPDHSIPFSKFIPAYHYYFNRQCKVSIFGFSKLIDLFESISPEVVEIIDRGPGEDKIIKLALADDLILSPNASQSSGLQPNSSQSSGNGSHPSSSSPSSSENVSSRSSSSGGSTTSEQFCSNSSSTTTTDTTARSSTTMASNSAGAFVKQPQLHRNHPRSNNNTHSQQLNCSPSIDTGPTKEELIELERELDRYEAWQRAQGKRSQRMAASLDVFRCPIY